MDGGVCSASNLDLLARTDVDVVICMNPLSSLHRGKSLNPLERVSQLSREANGRRLGHEARKVRAAGKKVVLIQPTEEDLEVMGGNLMDPRRRRQVIEKAERTVAEQLQDPAIGDVLSDLPEGEPHKIRRPSGPPSSWPTLVTGARRAA